MNILAIDTAVNILSAALGTNDGQWYFEADAGLHHSALLMEIIDMLVKKAGLTPSDLDGVVCMRGPGSFTGLRIGFAAAKGLALSLNIPMASVSTLDCMAFPFSFWPGLILPLIDAKKNSYFTALYRDGRRVSEDTDAGAVSITSLISTEKAQNPAEKHLVITGPGAEMFYKELENIPLPSNVSLEDIKIDPESRRGKANALLAIAKNMNILNNERVIESSGPEYIRKSDAELQFLRTVGNNG